MVLMAVLVLQQIPVPVPVLVPGQRKLPVPVPGLGVIHFPVDIQWLFRPMMVLVPVPVAKAVQTTGSSSVTFYRTSSNFKVLPQ